MNTLKCLTTALLPYHRNITLLQRRHRAQAGGRDIKGANRVPPLQALAPSALGRAAVGESLRGVLGARNLFLAPRAIAVEVVREQPLAAPIARHMACPAGRDVREVGTVHYLLALSLKLLVALVPLVGPGVGVNAYVNAHGCVREYERDILDLCQPFVTSPSGQPLMQASQLLQVARPLRPGEDDVGGEVALQ